MPILHDPVLTLEGVSFKNISLSTLDLEVTIRVENKNPMGATLKECPFAVLYQKDGTNQQIATGNTGGAKIAASTRNRAQGSGYIAQHGSSRGARNVCHKRRH